MDYNTWESRVSVDEDSNAVACEAVNLYIVVGVSGSLLPSSSGSIKSKKMASWTLKMEATSSSESLERFTNQNDVTSKET
jgi:hypothetical protein